MRHLNATPSVSYSAFVTHDVPDNDDAIPAGDGTRLSIGELAERADVSRRAVRYYVHEGLLPGPIGLGRGAYYTDHHLSSLIRLRDLQAQGLGLAAVRQRLVEDAPLEPESAPSNAAPIASSAWTHVAIADGVVLQLRADVRVPADVLRQLSDLLRAHTEPVAHPLPKPRNP